MTKCDCGQEIATRFCPGCGRAATGEVNSLLTHILKVSTATKTRMKLLRKFKLRGDPISDEHLAKLEARAELWDSWADWVRKAEVLAEAQNV